MNLETDLVWFFLREGFKSGTLIFLISKQTQVSYML